jgi:hypothetical protein
VWHRHSCRCLLPQRRTLWHRQECLRHISLEARDFSGTNYETPGARWKTHLARTQSHSWMGWPAPQARLLFTAVLLAAAGSYASWAQRAAALNLQAPAAGQGKLAVTATVVSSAGMMIGPDGQPAVIVANAPSPGDILSASLHTSQPAFFAGDECPVKASGVARVRSKVSASESSQDEVHSRARSATATKK